MIKILGAKLLLFFLSWLRIIPIVDGKIIFFSYQGKGCNCNPKYIAKYLLGKKVPSQLCIYFAAKEKSKVTNVFCKRVNFVRYGSVHFLYHLATAKVIVTNSSNLPWFPYKKDQILINTWHGGGAYKSEWYDLRLTKFKNNRVDYFISSSREFTNLLARSTGLSKEKFIRAGMPRNDVLINCNENDKDDLLSRYGLSKSYRYLLYAPTYRDDSNVYPYPDFEKILQALERKFCGQWKLLVRGHYNVTNIFKENGNDVIYRDMSLYDDMQEILMISDAVITDYSSLIWDYSFLCRPCFLYVPDLQQYERVRGFYYPLSSWGFPYAESMSDLIKIVDNFDKIKFYESMKRHHDKLGSFEKGIASQMVGDLILKHLVGERI